MSNSDVSFESHPKLESNRPLEFPIQYEYCSNDFYESPDSKDILQTLANATQLQPLDPAEQTSVGSLPHFEVIVNPSLHGVNGRYTDYIDGEYFKLYFKLIESRLRIRTRL